MRQLCFAALPLDNDGIHSPAFCFNVSGIFVLVMGKSWAGKKRSDFCFWHIDSFFFPFYTPVTPFCFSDGSVFSRGRAINTTATTPLFHPIFPLLYTTDGADEFLLSHCGRKGCWAGSRNNEDTPGVLDKDVHYHIRGDHSLVLGLRNLTDIF